MKNGRGPAGGVGSCSAWRGLVSGGRAALWGGVADGAAVGEASGQPGVGEGGMGEPAEAPARVANKTAVALERQICAVRQALAVESALGFCGAQAVAEELKAQDVEQVPSVRTINRILARHGLQDAHARAPEAPVPGWYLPTVREDR